MSSLDMDAAHRRDYADMARMRELRLKIEAFLADPPGHAQRSTFVNLREAVVDLEGDEAHIVRVWD